MIDLLTSEYMLGVLKNSLAIQWKEKIYIKLLLWKICVHHLQTCRHSTNNVALCVFAFNRWHE